MNFTLRKPPGRAEHQNGDGKTKDSVQNSLGSSHAVDEGEDSDKEDAEPAAGKKKKKKSKGQADQYIAAQMSCL